MARGRTPRECVSWNMREIVNCKFFCWSHSTWVRELKFSLNVISIFLSACRTPRELKSCGVKAMHRYFKVALHVSAWVEIARQISHVTLPFFGRTPRECVSWNWFQRRIILMHRVALHVSAWVEMLSPCWHLVGWRLSHSTWVRELKFWNHRN